MTPKAEAMLATASTKNETTCVSIIHPPYPHDAETSSCPHLAPHFPPGLVHQLEDCPVRRQPRLPANNQTHVVTSVLVEQLLVELDRTRQHSNLLLPVPQAQAIVLCEILNLPDKMPLIYIHVPT